MRNYLRMSEICCTFAPQKLKQQYYGTGNVK